MQRKSVSGRAAGVTTSKRADTTLCTRVQLALRLKWGWGGLIFPLRGDPYGVPRRRPTLSRALYTLMRSHEAGSRALERAMACVYASGSASCSWAT